MEHGHSRESVPPAKSVSVSPWVTFLNGTSAVGRFIYDMQHGITVSIDERTGKRTRTRTDRVIRPEVEDIAQFAEVIATEPKRIERLIQLLQESAVTNGVVHRIVLDLSEAGIRRLGIATSPEPLDATSFREAAESWLARVDQRPLKADNLNTLLLLIAFGGYREYLDQEGAFGLIAEATRTTTQPRTRTQSPKSISLLHVLLSVPLTESTIGSLLDYFHTSTAETADLRSQIRSATERSQSLVAEAMRLAEAIDDMRTEIASLKSEVDADRATISQLELQNLSTRASYQHTLDDVRGRIRGALEGNLTRWLETGLDAAEADPPQTVVVKERIQQALKLIEKEIQWLRPSG